MVVFPFCKINLGLHILSKRENGYHDVETVFYPIPWTDVLEIVPVAAAETTFGCTGSLVSMELENNLCWRAYQLLKNDYGIGGVKMHLHKIIPIGAGLGGGSSDAAHTLLLLNSIFNLSLSVEKLMNYAAQIGSDCPFFIQNEPAKGTGRGEVLTQIDIDLKNHYLIIVKPHISVSTKEAYAGIVPHKPQISLSEAIKYPVANWRTVVKNDFEDSIFKKYPAIEKIKNTFYDTGAIYSSMSGSGSSVYGLFDKPISLKEKFKGLDYWEGKLT